MFSFSVVEDLNVFEYGPQGILGSLETFVMNQFRLDDAEKGFGHGIVPAIAFTAHALDETMLSQYLPKILASILNAAGPSE